MIKILLSGEGKTDYGITDSYGNWIEGPIQHYIRRIMPNQSITIIPYDRKAEKPKNRLRFQSHRNLKGHAFEAFILAVEASERGCDTAAFYVDADRAGKSERECRDRYNELKDSILNAIQRVPGINGVAVIPVKMIESWLMGDCEAMERLYGKPSGRPDVPGKPELDWGDPRDPESNFPKNRLKRVLECYHKTSGLDVFCDIADEADLDIVRHRCPISFEDFYLQLTSIR